MLLRDGKGMKDSSWRIARRTREETPDTFEVHERADSDLETGERTTCSQESACRSRGRGSERRRDDEDREGPHRERTSSSRQAKKKLRHMKQTPRSPPDNNGENGLNMREFIDLVEMTFLEQGIDRRRWGNEMRYYLVGDALSHWVYLHHGGMRMDDWSIVKQSFYQRFCNLSHKGMMREIAKNIWKGDHVVYSSRFAQIVQQGPTMPPSQLLGFYLANLPGECYKWLTRRGMKSYKTWEEAAAALDKMQGVWEQARDKRRRNQRLLEDALRSDSETEENKPSSNSDKRRDSPSSGQTRHGSRLGNHTRQDTSRRGAGRDTQVEMRCYEYCGKGHLDRYCPLCNGAERRPGETCSRCAGRDHYAAQCATPREGTPYEGRSSSRNAPRERRGSATTRQTPKLGSLDVNGDGRTRLTAHVGKGGTVETGSNAIEVSSPKQQPSSLNPKVETPPTGEERGSRERNTTEGSKAIPTAEVQTARPQDDDQSHETDLPSGEGQGRKEEGLKEAGGTPDSLWWRGGETSIANSGYEGLLSGVGKTAILRLEIAGYACEGLLHTGASRSFIRQTTVGRLGLKVHPLPESCTFTAANGEILHINHTVPRVTMLCGGELFTWDFLVGSILYDIIIGLDCLVKHNATWDFRSSSLHVFLNGRWCKLPVQKKYRGYTKPPGVYP